VAVKKERIVRGTHRLIVGELVGIGVNEKLADQRRAVGAGEQSHSRGQVRTGAVATDREAGWVRADLVRVLGDPAHRRVAVVDRRREGMLRCQPVANHDDQRAGRVGQAPADAIGGVDGAQDPAATEEVEQRGQRPLAGGPVQPQRELAARPGNRQVGHLIDGLRLAPALPDRGKIRGPGFGERHGVQRRNIVALTLVADRLQLRVEGHSLHSHLAGRLAQDRIFLTINE
jgi:hypothetical protein